jgi:protein-disulfide isomerase
MSAFDDPLLDRRTAVLALSGAALTLLAATPAKPAAWSQTVTTSPIGAVLAGNPDAKVRLVEYFSYTCHVCADFAKAGSLPLKTQYVDRGLVLLEYRNLVRDPVDMTAALLARCGGPKAFAGNHQAIFAAFPAFIAKVQKATEAQQKSWFEGTTAERARKIAAGTGLTALMRAPRLHTGADRRRARQRGCTGRTHRHDQHRPQRRPRRWHADFFRQRPQRRGHRLARAQIETRPCTQGLVKAPHSLPWRKNDMTASLRIALLSSLGALALAGCGGGATDQSKEQEVVAKVAPPAGKSWSQVVRVDGDGVVMGNPDAPIKLEEYGAFTCGHCAQFAKDSHEELKRDFVDTGRVSYKLTPFMLHPVDAIAGAIVKCTGPDRFFPLADATFLEHEAFVAGASKPQPGIEEAMKLPPAQRFTALAKGWGIDQFYQQRGVPAATIQQCLAKVENVEAIEKGTNAGVEKYQITGTPTFIINGQVAEGVASWGPLRDRLRTMGAR